jgi:peptide deformylase
MKPIVLIPNPVLTTPAKPVTGFDKKLHQLIADLTETLTVTQNPKGVGLAAPQIGQPWRVFVIKPTEKSAIRNFVNPEIVATGNLDTYTKTGDSRLEGCLSIPTIWGKVRRYQTITLKYQDESGAPHTETFSGFPATIIQHETDHLNGKLFTMRVVEQAGKLYESGRDKQGKEVLEEIKF